MHVVNNYCVIVAQLIILKRFRKETRRQKKYQRSTCFEGEERQDNHNKFPSMDKPVKSQTKKCIQESIIKRVKTTCSKNRDCAF